MTDQEKAFWELWDKLEPLMAKTGSKPTLREMFDYGYQAAETRIIKLLEDRRGRTGEKYAGIANFDHRMIGIAIEEEFSRSIALIKGKTNE